MKIGTMNCPFCGSSWVAVYPEEMIVLPCPFCDGVSGAPDDGLSLSGMCALCGNALDDHAWKDDEVGACPTPAGGTSQSNWAPPF